MTLLPNKMAATLFQFFKIFKNITAADFDNFPVLATNEERGKLKKKFIKKKNEWKNQKFEIQMARFGFLFLFFTENRRHAARQKKKKIKCFYFYFSQKMIVHFSRFCWRMKELRLSSAVWPRFSLADLWRHFQNFGPFSLKQSLKKNPEN